MKKTTIILGVLALAAIGLIGLAVAEDTTNNATKTDAWTCPYEGDCPNGEYNTDGEWVCNRTATDPDRDMHGEHVAAGPAEHGAVNC